MANNLKHPLEDPPSLSSSAGDFLFISSQEEDEEGEDQHTIFSSDEAQPEDLPPPRSSSEALLQSGRKLRSRGISTNVSSKQGKKTYTQGEKNGSDLRRLFREKDEIVLLQSIIDSKGKNPLEDSRSLYEFIKGSLSNVVTLRQFREKIQSIRRKYITKEMRGGDEQASASNPHQLKCFLLSKAIWGAEGIVFESSNGKSKESERRVSKNLELISSRWSRSGKDVQKGSKREDMEKSPHVGKESDDWDENSFFLGMDFLKEKWTKVTIETKKEIQEKMKKLHANELECQKYEEMLKVMKDERAHDKVELLNEVTSLIMAVE